MKQMMQIALGVFIGAVSSQLVLDEWHTYKNERLAAAERTRLAAQEQEREAKLSKARSLIMQQLRGNAGAESAGKAQAGGDAGNGLPPID